MSGKHSNRNMVIGLLIVVVVALALVNATDPDFFNGLMAKEATYQDTKGAGNYVWQSLYITPNDGSKPYWVNAFEPFEPKEAAIFGSNHGDFKQIQTLQNNIYTNIHDSGVTSWSFTCTETITLQDRNYKLIATIVQPTAIAKSGQAITAGQNIWVTGASFSEASMQTIINQPAGNYYYVISLSNIQFTLMVNGQAKTYTATSGDNANVLYWAITIT